MFLHVSVSHSVLGEVHARYGGGASVVGSMCDRGHAWHGGYA